MFHFELLSPPVLLEYILYKHVYCIVEIEQSSSRYNSTIGILWDIGHLFIIHHVFFTILRI